MDRRNKKPTRSLKRISQRPQRSRRQIQNALQNCIRDTIEITHKFKQSKSPLHLLEPILKHLHARTLLPKALFLSLLLLVSRPQNRSVLPQVKTSQRRNQIHSQRRATHEFKHREEPLRAHEHQEPHPSRNGQKEEKTKNQRTRINIQEARNQRMPFQPIWR